MSLRILPQAALSLTLILFLSPFASAQWAGQVGGTSSDQSGDVAIDGSDNIFITGNFTGDADFDNDGVFDDASSVGGEDIFLAKYDDTGDLLWVVSAGGSGSDEGFAVAVDASGDAYITGYFSNSADFDGDGMDDATATSARDMFLAKYDASGAFQWVRTAGGLTGNGQDAGKDIDIDGSHVFLTGYFRGDADFNNDGVADILNSGQQDAFVARYDTAGSLDWVSAIGGGQADEGAGIAADGIGGAFITGSFKGNIDITGNGVDDLISAGGDDAYVVSCDGVGAMVWALAVGGTGSDMASHMGRDAATGDIYVTGEFRGSADFDGDGVPDLAATSAADMYIVKYNSAGAMQWAKSASGSTNETSHNLFVDAGGVLVTGGYQGTIDFDNDGVPESTSTSGVDVFVAVYRTDGSFAEFLVASGNGSDWGTGVVVDSAESMYVVGTFQNNLDILDDGDDDLETYGSHDVFLFCAPRLLPVELVSFNATVDGDDVLLMWETASETNNAGFEVQVRSEGGVFEAVGFVEGHGTTTEAQVYSHTVIDLDPGTYAFRLRQIDYDGAFEYSPAIEATVGVPGSHVLSAVYPNPFNPQTNFTLAVRETQSVAITVHDVLGREVVTLFDGNVEGGSTHTFTWQASGLPSGMYIIRVIGESFAETRSVTLLQ